jgi:hypothetical protein
VAEGVPVPTGVLAVDNVAVASGGVLVDEAVLLPPPHAVRAMRAIPKQIVVSFFKAVCSS